MRRLRARLYHQLHVGAWPSGRLTALNVFLVWIIIAAVAVAILATEPAIHAQYAREILITELVFGGIFLIEYLARIYAAAERPGPESDWAKRWRFMRSPLGLIDLFVVLVSFAPFLTADGQILRLVRLLRVFSVMKFGRFSAAARMLVNCISERSYDLLVCVAFAFLLLLAGSTGMFWAEGDVQPDAFGSIPRALWWAIITLTTVGYGDVSPITPLGKVIASTVAIGGILLVAMPTGIIAAAFSDAMQRRREEIAQALEEAQGTPDEVARP